MRIAVPYENGLVFQHFGHTSEFKLYDVENGQITGEEAIGSAGSGHGALAGFLSGLGVDTLVCGGVSGGADEAVRALLAGTLDYDAHVQCSHHGHHGEQGSCGGEHGCGG